MTQAVHQKKLKREPKIHFEANASAYEKIKSAFDAVRVEIDAGISGTLDEMTALQKARSRLYELGRIVNNEVCIVLEAERRAQNKKGGMQ